MSANNLQALLRFLSQDAKVPLATAMSKVKDLQKANLGTPEDISKVKVDSIKAIFPDEKMAKQILTAAKRVSKKRAAGVDAVPSPRKKRKESLFSEDVMTPTELEASLVLPEAEADEAEIAKTVLFTNRAPLVLAFAVTLLKYTMPEQPLSSRLSLAQAVVSVNSRSKAVSLGLETGRSAEEEGFGEGQPVVKIMNRDIHVLRRWGYEWKTTEPATEASTQGTLEAETEEERKEQVKTEEDDLASAAAEDDETALWGIDLEALKKSNGPLIAGAQAGANSSLPIYTPQSARAYLQKSFDTAPSALQVTEPTAKKKPSAAAKSAEKDRNLGLLLKALDLLYQSWVDSLDSAELDKRAWSWYVRVRPEVNHGVAGWGGKGEVKLSDILELRRKS